MHNFPVDFFSLSSNDSTVYTSLANSIDISFGQCKARINSEVIRWKINKDFATLHVTLLQFPGEFSYFC